MSADSPQIARMKKDRFICDLIGIRLEEAGVGFARSSLLLRDNHLNGLGVVQGGVLYSIADFTFAAAGNWDTPMIGIDTTISFLKSVKSGTVFAEAKEVSRTGRFSVCEVRVTDENQNLLALFVGRGYLLPPPKERREQES